MRNYAGATGLKTGSTSISLFSLSATATRDNLSLIAAIMRAETSNIRFAEAQKLLDYGFKNYEYSMLGKKGEVFKTANVDKGVLPTVDIIFELDSGTLAKKGSLRKFIYKYYFRGKYSSACRSGPKTR